MSTKSVKVAITGVAGRIGQALLFRIASGQMFGPQTPVELQLLELPTALERLRGMVMELEDCAFPLLKKIVYTDDTDKAFADANWAILVGSVPRKKGMERGDLLKVNGKIFTHQGESLNRVAAKDIRVLVVGNPCNTNALVAMHGAKDIPPDRFFAMTMLDENRAKAQLALKAGVPVTAVTQMTIWGNHSATQWPDFYNAKINGQETIQVIGDEEWAKNTFVETVQKRGAEIIKAMGVSSSFSAASAIIDTVYKMTNDTPANDSFSLALASNGEYGVEKGIIFSYPCQVKEGKLEVVQNIVQTPYGQKKFETTHQELLQEFKSVQEMKLI